METANIQTPWWKLTKKIALINNVSCYGLLAVLILFDIEYLMQCPDENSSNKICAVVSKNGERKMLSSWIILIIWQILFVLMIVFNHKLRTKLKPKIHTIKLWLWIHGIVCGFLLVAGSIILFTEASAITFLFGMIVAAEFYIVKNFYNEECRDLATSNHGLVNVNYQV